MTRWNGRSGYSGKRSHVLRNVLPVLALIGLLGFSALRFVVSVNSRDSIQGDPQLMIVFGCKVEPYGPSVMLRDRLDTAFRYLSAEPDVTAVLTGGQGDDEHISEAQAMFDYLTDRGIEADRLLMEDQSHNTWKNINYSLARLEEEGYTADQDVLLVSSGFHLARIEMLWERAAVGDHQISTLAAPVSHVPSAIQMFFREPLALVKSFIFDR